MIIYSHQSNKMKNRCEFANHKDKVRFYTGLSSFDSLNAVFLQVSPYVSCDTLNLTIIKFSRTCHDTAETVTS